nr:GGDEF domain-containing protein [Pseudomonas sp.]
VSRGARILNETSSQHLRDSEFSRADLSLAQQYLGSVMDLALEVMSAAYMQDSRRGVRADEAYRLFALGQNASAERERQRAALLEWGHEVLMRTPFHGQTVRFPTLRTSEFGLWLHHKGSAMFDGTAELPSILAAMSELDDEVLPALAQAVADGDAVDLARRMQTFQRKIDDIKYLLMTLFDRVSALEGGRDPLTQLLNRRFLPTVLSREIALATSGKGTFSVFLADIDHFKQINDGYGHSGGDAVLRQVAELLQDTCRTGDYVFRYGGEEFLVVLVDARADVLQHLAEKLRSAVEQHHFRLPDGQSLSVTISIGAAAFDGHPDPDMLVSRADKALYAAKAAGRNGWKLG